jgi:hypothetical protein
LDKEKLGDAMRDYAKWITCGLIADMAYSLLATLPSYSPAQYSGFWSSWNLMALVVFISLARPLIYFLIVPKVDDKVQLAVDSLLIAIFVTVVVTPDFYIHTFPIAVIGPLILSGTLFYIGYKLLSRCSVLKGWKVRMAAICLAAIFIFASAWYSLGTNSFVSALSLGVKFVVCSLIVRIIVAYLASRKTTTYSHSANGTKLPNNWCSGMAKQKGKEV